jgi:hypothetical protein
MSSYEKKQQNFFSKRTDFVVFSDSHGANGLNEQEGFSNFSMRGDNLISIADKAKFYVNLHQPKGVILPADSHLFANYRLMQDQSPKVNDFLMSTAPVFEFMRPIYRQYLLEYWKGVFHKASVSEDIYKDKKKKILRITDKQSSEIKRISSLRVQLHRPIRKPVRSIHAHAFEDAIREISAKETKVCIVAFPLSTPYRDEMKKYMSFDLTSKYFQSIAEKYNIVYIDYRSKFKDNQFSDPDHLNTEGARNLTSQILNDCFGVD